MTTEDIENFSEEGQAEVIAVLMDTLLPPYDSDGHGDRGRVVTLDVAIAAQHLIAGRIYHNESPGWLEFWWNGFTRKLYGIFTLALVALNVFGGQGTTIRIIAEAILASIDVQAAEEAAKRTARAADIVANDLRGLALFPSRKRRRHRDTVSSRNPKP